MDLVEKCDDVEEIVQRVEKCIKKGKFQTLKIQKDFKGQKESYKIFKSKIIIEKNLRNEVFKIIKNDGTGEVLNDVYMIYRYILDFNIKTMRKEEPDEAVLTVQNMKRQYFQVALKLPTYYPQYIPWENYLKVMKVMKQKKNCFRDFHYSGSKFKVTGYKLLNKIYEQEIIPESMLTANLTKIFQMHGDLNSLKNYRFIPGRGWMSKLFEKCLVCIVNEEIDK